MCSVSFCCGCCFIFLVFVTWVKNSHYCHEARENQWPHLQRWPASAEKCRRRKKDILSQHSSDRLSVWLATKIWQKVSSDGGQLFWCVFREFAWTRQTWRSPFCAFSRSYNLYRRYNSLPLSFLVPYLAKKKKNKKNKNKNKQTNKQTRNQKNKQAQEQPLFKQAQLPQSLRYYRSVTACVCLYQTNIKVTNCAFSRSYNWFRLLIQCCCLFMFLTWQKQVIYYQRIRPMHLPFVLD